MSAKILTVDIVICYEEPQSKKNALFWQVLNTDKVGTLVDLVLEMIFCPNLAAILYFEPLNDE